MRIDKTLAAIVCAAAAMALAPDLAQAQATCSKIVVTGHPEYPPVGFKDGERIVGVGIDVLTKLAGDLGVAVESKHTGSWADAQAAMRGGTADAIVGIYFNDERAQYLDYVRPSFMPDPVVILVARGKGFAFAGRDSLVGKKGVTNEGESYGPDLDAFIVQRLTVARAKGVEATLNDLAAGRADYAIIGLYPGFDEAAKHGLADKVEALEPPLLTAEMFLAFSKKSACRDLAGKVATALAAMRTDGRLDVLVRESTTKWQKR